MLIFDENTHAIIVDSITTPMLTEYFWVLDLELMDFTVIPLIILEEVVAPTMTLQIHGFKFNVPTTWSILVYAEDTMQLDVVNISDLAGRDFTAVVYNNIRSNVQPGRITIIDYLPEATNHCPSFGKHQMLCHPIGPDEWVNVAPSDVYNKYLKDKVVGDITT